jgi:hypothetical protein
VFGPWVIEAPQPLKCSWDNARAGTVQRLYRCGCPGFADREEAVMTTATVPTITAEQLMELLAALRGAADTLRELHEDDSPVTEYFDNIASGLQVDIFGSAFIGDGLVETQEEVEIAARACEHHANALERVTPHFDRITIARNSAMRYRNVGSTNVEWSTFVTCSSCGAIENGAADGWTHAPDDSLDLFCPECSARGHVDAR